MPPRFFTRWLPIALLLGGHVYGQSADSIRVAFQVDSLIQISRALTAKGNLEEALAVNDMAAQLARSRQGERSPVYANTCFNRGRVLFLAGGPGYYREAEKWYIQSRDIREAALGKDHLEYAWSVNNLGAIYDNEGQYAKALEHYREAMSIRAKKLGESHPLYFGSVGNVANLLWKMGQLDEALKLAHEMAAFSEATYGKESPAHAQNLNFLAVLYYGKTNYNKAISLHREVLALRAKISGITHPDYAQSLHNIGNVYLSKGMPQQALSSHLEAHSIWNTAGKANQLFFAQNLIALGVDYIYLGRYREAGDAFREGLILEEKLLGKKSPVYQKALLRASELYEETGELDKAFEYCLKAKALMEEDGNSTSHPEVLTRLYSLYINTGAYDKALPLALQTQDILIKENRTHTAFYARCLQAIGNIYEEKKAFDKALAYLLEAKDLLKQVSGTETHAYGVCLNNLAILYHDSGDYDKAQQYYLEAYRTWSGLFGENYPNCIRSLHNLALIASDKGDIEAARTYFLAANKGAFYLMETSAGDYTEQELLQYQASFDSRIGSLYYFSSRHPELFIAGVAFDNALYLKNGLLFNAIERDAAMAHLDQPTQALYQEWKSTRYQLSKHYATPLSERNNDLISELEVLENELDRALAARSFQWVQSRKQIQWKEIQQVLKPGEAALEFVHFKFNNPRPNDSILYAAILLRSDSPEPLFIPLFEEKQLTPLLKGAVGGNNFLQINALYQQPELYQLIWKPLESTLQGINTIYTSPSGLLHRINLAAIRTPNGKTIGESRQLVIMGSTRQLIQPAPAANTQTPTAYLAGGIRYHSDTTAITYALRETGARSAETTYQLPFTPDSANTRAGKLRYLPATATEVRETGQSLKNARYEVQTDTGFYATEESFRQLGTSGASPTLLHLATHGFFFPDPVNSKNLSGSVFKLSDHPMIRSGLIMAGAQAAWSGTKAPDGREDGILTAYEISQMNLSNTQLVVLSACETGLGDIAGNEGVYGLQRAFKIAGAKYLIMSLWKVDDQSTKAFMTTFYHEWLEQKRSIPDAFRHAQQKMSKTYPNPYDWAGFILIE